MHTSLTNIRRVGIYDDMEDERESLAETLLDAGYSPVPCGPIQQEDLCVAQLKTFDAAIVDHRLSQGDYGNYKGASVVKRLYLDKHPALLVSGWSRADPEDVQPFQRYLSLVLRKGEYDISDVGSGFDRCLQEFDGKFSPTRIATRTLIQIARDFDADSSRQRVDALIPSWDPRQGVTFPVEIIPVRLRNALREGRHFFAHVNTGAESQDDLFYENFSLAPENNKNEI